MTRMDVRNVRGSVCWFHSIIRDIMKGRISRRPSASGRRLGCSAVEGTDTVRTVLERSLYPPSVGLEKGGLTGPPRSTPLSNSGRLISMNPKRGAVIVAVIA